MLQTSFLWGSLKYDICVGPGPVLTDPLCVCRRAAAGSLQWTVAPCWQRGAAASADAGPAAVPPSPLLQGREEQNWAGDGMTSDLCVFPGLPARVTQNPPVQLAAVRPEPVEGAAVVWLQEAERHAAGVLDRNRPGRIGRGCCRGRLGRHLQDAVWAEPQELPGRRVLPVGDRELRRPAGEPEPDLRARSDLL